MCDRKLAALQKAALTSGDSTSTNHPSNSGPGHNFHVLQVDGVSSAAPYTNLSCAVYDGSTTIRAVPVDFIQARYNMTFRQSTTGFDGTRVGIYGGFTDEDNLFGVYSHECWSAADLTNIGAAYNFQQLPIPGTAPYARVNDLLYQQQQIATEENSLDSQSVYLVSPTSSVSITPVSDEDSLFSYFSRILNMLPSQRPHVVSMSYLFFSDAEAFLGTGVADAVDSVLMQLGLVGTTVIVSSGDNGAPGENLQCITPPPAYFGVTEGNLVPGYPAASPYVLTVGATDFSYGLGTTRPETLEHFTAVYGDSPTTPRFCSPCGSEAPNASIVCQSSFIAEQAVSINLTVSNVNSEFTSGGGFSSYAPMPSYQQNAVQTYLDSACTPEVGCTLPPSTYFNRSNRAFPDVSIFGGTHGLIDVQGYALLIGGTSESAPMFAGVVARLNEVSFGSDQQAARLHQPAAVSDGGRYGGLAARPACIQRHNHWRQRVPVGEHRAVQPDTQRHTHVGQLPGSVQRILHGAGMGSSQPILSSKHTSTFATHLHVTAAYPFLPSLLFRIVRSRAWVRPNVGVMVEYLTNLLSNSTREAACE